MRTQQYNRTFYGDIRRLAGAIARRVVNAGSTLLTGQHYDAAVTTSENARHWVPAKDETPYTTNNPATRARLRARARYEADNNCYCGGLVSTLASDTVGWVLPVPQVSTGDAVLDKYLEQRFTEWANSASVNLHRKLLILDMGARTDGDSFLSLVSDDTDTLRETKLTLNATVIPSYRVAGDARYNSAQVFTENGRRLIDDDGVIVNAVTGIPQRFRVGELADDNAIYSTSPNLIQSKPVYVNADFMKFWVRPKRAEQIRGVCEIAASLPIYAQLRRFGLATLSAAEVAAMFTAVIQTNLPVEEVETLKPFAARELSRNMVTSLPEGWEIQQLQAQHPISSMEMFVNLCLREVGRALDVPFGVVAGDYSRYNFSSARLEVVGYDERKKGDRNQLVVTILNPVFYMFLAELVYERGLYAEQITRAMVEGYRVSWKFVNRPALDPVKDATVDDIRLKNGTTTYSDVYAQQGVDYLDKFAQLRKEQAEISRNGLTFIRELDVTTQLLPDANGDPVLSKNPA